MFDRFHRFPKRHEKSARLAMKIVNWVNPNFLPAINWMQP